MGPWIDWSWKNCIISVYVCMPITLWKFWLPLFKERDVGGRWDSLLIRLCLGFYFMFFPSLCWHLWSPILFFEKQTGLKEVYKEAKHCKCLKRSEKKEIEVGTAELPYTSPNRPTYYICIFIIHWMNECFPMIFI